MRTISLEERKEFGAKIRDIRLLRNLTQVELATKIGASQEWISHYESGRRLPDFTKLKALVSALDCDANSLLGL